MTQIAETPRDEQAKVESWRLHVLMEAGYPLPLAEKTLAIYDEAIKEGWGKRDGAWLPAYWPTKNPRTGEKR
jgi:hypothetical protein